MAPKTHHGPGEQPLFPHQGTPEDAAIFGETPVEETMPVSPVAEIPSTELTPEEQASKARDDEFDRLVDQGLSNDVARARAYDKAESKTASDQPEQTVVEPQETAVEAEPEEPQITIDSVETETAEEPAEATVEPKPKRTRRKSTLGQRPAPIPAEYLKSREPVSPEELAVRALRRREILDPEREQIRQDQEERAAAEEASREKRREAKDAELRQLELTVIHMQAGEDTQKEIDILTELYNRKPSPDIAQRLDDLYAGV